jgi:hypothetical protein
MATRSRLARLSLAVATVALVVLSLLRAPAAVAEGVTAEPMEIDLDLQHGATADLENGALQFTFVGIQEDSRCPKDVLCVWQGQAVTSMHVAIDGVDQGDITLTLIALAPTGGSPVVTVGSYAFRLDYLSPYPSASQPTPPEQYLAAVHVQRS